MHSALEIFDQDHQQRFCFPAKFSTSHTLRQCILLLHIWILKCDNCLICVFFRFSRWSLVSVRVSHQQSLIMSTALESEKCRSIGCISEEWREPVPGGRRCCRSNGTAALGDWIWSDRAARQTSQVQKHWHCRGSHLISLLALHNIAIWF